jgi:hypothetical protein
LRLVYQTKVTPNETLYLPNLHAKKLISLNGYPEIDLQYEILDQVACNVEVLLEEKPAMKLDHAFRIVHGEFGVFGFSNLEESYIKSIKERYRRFFWEEFMYLFLSYRIVYPIAVAFILYWMSVYTRPFGYELKLAIYAVIFFVLGALYVLIGYSRIDKSLKNYVAFKSSFTWLSILGLFLQLNFWALHLLENPDFNYEFGFQKNVMWIAMGLITLAFFSIFLIPKVLNRSILETRKLQAIYES